MVEGLKEALQYITGLKAKSMEPKLVEIEGRTYCTDNDLTRYHRFPMASDIELFEVSGEDSGIILKNYQVPLQTMLLDAFDQALALQDARLEIRYKQGPANGRGYVLLKAVPITDHSSNIELNEDGSVKLNILDYQNGVRS